MQRDERALVEDASRGDLTAVEGLLTKHVGGLVAFVRRRAGGVLEEKESASDLVQSVCREVLEHLRDDRLEYRGEAEFRAWLYEAALFKIKNRRRYWSADRRDASRRRGLSIEGASGSALERDLPDPLMRSPSSLAGLREEAERAHDAFAELPERYRRILELSRFQGLSHKEVAARLGITEAASRMLLSRALARLSTLAERRGG